jgi:hypothetical protein
MSVRIRAHGVSKKGGEVPFHLRRSVQAGPFRFNFSNGGVGASVGIRGLRIGTGPRGHYVHAGRGGIYYRATLGRAGDRRTAAPARSAAPEPQNAFAQDGVTMVEVESGDVLAMRDETVGELLDEINAKRRQVSMAAALGWSGAGVGLLAMLLLGPAGFLVALLGAIGWAVGRWLDSYRRTCVLFYDLEPEVQRVYEEAVAGFDGLAGCAAKWHVEAGGAVRDLTTWKRNAGATHIVRKKPTVLDYKLPPTITSNITPPALHVGKQIIFFFPDFALMDDGRSVGAVPYSQLSIAWQDSNFIEDGPVPRDAAVIGQTWKHPNKSGGPDRRFRDNRQIPICRYEAMHLTSSSGINELIEFSRSGVAAPFVTALKRMPGNASLAQTRAIGVG